MNIIFMGTSDYAREILKTILIEKSLNVVALFTQPDKPSGRKQLLTAPSTKDFLIKNSFNIPIFQPQKLRGYENIEIIKQLKPDFIIVASYGQILPKDILDIAPCINLHASILPNYRGASPVQSQILHDDDFIGVTAMLMNEGLDTGDILGFRILKHDKSKDVEEIKTILSVGASSLLIKVLKEFYKLKHLAQENLNATYVKKIKKSDGLVDFIDAVELFSKFKAYKNWPQIYTTSNLKLKNIELIDANFCGEPFRILEIRKDGFICECKKGLVKVLKVQPESKNEMNATDYLRGKRLEVGDYLS